MSILHGRGAGARAAQNYPWRINHPGKETFRLRQDFEEKGGSYAFTLREGMENLLMSPH
ncbi:hypothetical protein [Rhizobium sp. LC145]|uniref:hypothetical protein n=1 Tax=Rhizobium sp. LC145 TaxID=1120688 RepID=UPI000A66B6CA|nr:hypothetical protein [Rhizobium sp. LC145]